MPDLQERSVISFVYVTSHGFILLRSRPSTAAIVSPAAQCEPAQNYGHGNPNIGSHHFSTFFSPRSSLKRVVSLTVFSSQRLITSSNAVVRDSN